jgi:hypothetical protein
MSDQCTSVYGDYIQKRTAFSAASGTYESCHQSDPKKYPLDYSLQAVVDPNQARIETANVLRKQFQNQLAHYTSLVSSTKALLAATQPLKEYKTILQKQLNQATEQNKNLKEQIATGANVVNALFETQPQLTNTGPFGTVNDKQGILSSFLFFNSLFYILLSLYIYMRFKNSVSSAVIYAVIGLLLVVCIVGGGYLSYIILTMHDNIDSYNIFKSLLSQINMASLLQK